MDLQIKPVKREIREPFKPDIIATFRLLGFWQSRYMFSLSPSTNILRYTLTISILILNRGGANLTILLLSTMLRFFFFYNR